MKKRSSFLLALCLILVPSLAAADAAGKDWGQFRGPEQNGTAHGAGLFDDGLQGDGSVELEIAWKRPLGSGYSSISIVGDRGFTMFTDGTDDLLTAFDITTGKEIWRYRIAEMYKGHSGSDDGPISTPTIHDGVVYGLGPLGHLFAVGLEDGKEIWRRTLDGEKDSLAPEYGFSTAPLIEGDLVIIQTGGPAGHSITAFDRASGEPRWMTADDPVNYQSPVVLDLAGRRQVVAINDKLLLGLDPLSGEVLWSFEHGTSAIEAFAQPLDLGHGRLLINSTSEVVSVQVTATEGGKFSVEELWRSNAFKRSYAVPVVHEGYLYGFNSAFLSCLDAETGEVAWKSRPPGGDGLILVDGQLLILAPKGILVAVKASPEGYEETARLPVLAGGSFTAPSAAAGLIFVRDLKEMAAVRVVGTASSSATGTSATGTAGTARKVLETWVERVNNASPEELRNYISTTFSDTFLQQASVEQLLGFHQQIKAAGALEISDFESESDQDLVALLHSKSGTGLRTQLSVAGDPPKIAGLLIQPAAATGEPSDDTSGDKSAEALEWTQLDELAARVGEDAELPGVALAWARLGEDPKIGSAGLRQVGGSEEIEPTDRFHIGSITKSVTATVLGALVEKGKLSWTAPLRELLPGMQMNEAFADVELQRLLRHRAGIPQHSTFGDAEMARLNGLPGTPTEQRAAYVAEVLMLEPLNDGFYYSNAGYAIAGYIGERAASKSWEQLVHDEVFKPLGLETCGIGWPATAERPNQPRGHYGARGNRTAQEVDGEYQLGAFVRPAGDIHCSVGDLTRYGLAHLAGLSGKDGFLKAATIQELHRVWGDGVPYAAGWGVDPESGQHRHNGSAGTFFSYLTIDPKAGIVVAFLTNTDPTSGQPAAERTVSAILARHAEAEVP